MYQKQNFIYPSGEHVQSSLTLWDPMNCSPPGSSVHGISQVKIPEWVTVSYSRGSSQPRARTCVSFISCIGKQILYQCAPWEPLILIYAEVQFNSVAQSCLTFCNPMDCSTPGFPVHHQLPNLVPTHVHWVGDAVQPSHLCCSIPLLPSIFLSIRLFSNEPALHIRWPNYWSFSISPSNEYWRLISFRIDRLDLAAQGTLKSLLQHHSSKASILWRSAFLMVQLSPPYMTTGKTIALTMWPLTLFK